MKQDFAQFTIAGLPAGERLIWQGGPAFRPLAWRAFHIREVVIYFGALSAWRIGSNAAAGQSAAEVAGSVAWLAMPAILSVGVLSILAWLFARAARYTVTSKRVLIQFGVALPMTMNIPLDKIAGASLKTWRDGSGDIPLVIADERASFVLLWPHARPWKLRSVEPMLRALPDAAGVAAKLNDALAGQPGPSVLAITQPDDTRTGAMPNTTPAAA